METTEKRSDGWANLLTGLGIENRDKTRHTAFASCVWLNQQQLTDMYREDGFARRVVNLPAEEMVRQGFTVTNDEEDMIMARIEELGAMSQILKALKWSRLYGGGCVVMGIDDGRALDQPVDEANIRDIIFLRTFDRYQVSYISSDVVNDPSKPNFGEVEIYSVAPSTGGVPFRCHSSRMLIVDGEDIPDLSRSENNGWGDSIVQSCYNQLRALGGIYGAIENIVEDFVQGVMSIDNLQELIASGQEGLIKTRLGLIDLSRHVINTTLIDTKESYTRNSSNVGGLSELIDRYTQALSASTGIPITLLMGKSPAGLSATGDSDIRQWYDKIAAEQQSKLWPILNRLVKAIFLSKNYAFHGVEPENWRVKFNPLWQQSDAEKAATRKTVADADNIYLSTGVLTPEEIANSRFGGEEWSMDTALEFDRKAEQFAPAATAEGVAE